MRAALKALTTVMLALAASNAQADWANFATVSMTDPITPKLTSGYGCYTDGKDILCNSNAAAVTFGSGGLIDLGGLTVAGSVSAAAVSATYISGTVIQVNASTMPCSTGVNGAIRYSSTSNTLEVCSGTSWSTLSSNTAPGNINGSGSATAVAFWSGSNTLSYDAGLYWNNSAHRLGIGTTTPSNPLDVVNAANAAATFRNSTNLRAIMIDPGGNSIDASGTTLNLNRDTSSSTVIGQSLGVGTAFLSTPTATLQVSGTFAVSATNNSGLIVTSYGNVGISNTNPIGKLDVWGTISASDAIQVGQSNLTCITEISGSIRFNTTSNTLQVCTNVGWTSLASSTTGGGIALGDRITSGTSSVIVNNNGNVSISIAGGNTGWFENTKGLVVTGVSATGPVSGSGVFSNGIVGVQDAVNPGNGVHGMYAGGYDLVFYAESNGSLSGAVNKRLARVSQVGGSGLFAMKNTMLMGWSSNADPQTAPDTGLSRYSANKVAVGNASQNFSGALIASSIGVGTASPTASLQVSGTFAVSATNNTGLIVTSNGNVGISNTNPIAKLDVWGTISASDAIQVGQSNLTCISQISGSIRFNTTSNTLQVCTDGGWTSLASGTTSGITGGTANYGAIFSGPTTLTTDSALYIDRATHSVGIGTSSPLQPYGLHLNGVQGYGFITSANDNHFGSNVYYDGANWKFINDGLGSLLSSAASGTIEFYTTPGPGTAGGNATLKKGFVLTASSSVGIGTSSPSVSLSVVGEVQVSNSGIACVGTTRGGAIRYTSGTGIQYCDGNNTWTSLASGTTGGALTGSGSATAVAFWNGPDSLTYESATTSGLYWDHGTGHLGVGLNSPGVPLDVAGIIYARGTSSTGAVAIINPDATSGSNGVAIESSFMTGGYGPLVFRTTATERMRIMNGTGNVGIGTPNPTAALQVSGTFTVSNSAQAATAPSVYVGSNGNVGIGTLTPGASLTVLGEVQVSSTGAACVTAANAGAIRYAAGTLYYCNGSNTWSSITGGGSGFTGGGSATAIAFWNGPNSLTYEFATTSGLYWDHVNGRLGVGTSAPKWGLTVSGTAITNISSATDFLIYLSAAGKGNGVPVIQAADAQNVGTRDMALQAYGGNVGIGTITPTATLQVSGTFIVSQSGQTDSPSFQVGSGPTVGIGVSPNTIDTARARLYMKGIAQGANAACVSPAGNVGDQIYASNYNTMAFCNGADWVSMAGGVSVTINTTGGGATPAGSSADVQFNSSGALGADTGNFTYAAGLLKAPNISATAIAASGAGTFGTINSAGLGTLGSLIVIPAGATNDVQFNSSGALAADSGNFTYSGGLLTATSISASTVSATTLNGQYLSATTVYNPGTFSGNSVAANSVSSTAVNATVISTTYIQIPSATNVLACGSNLAGTMRYTSGTMQVCDGSSWGNVGIGIPTGTIAAFATSSCPSGWSEYTASRGRFLRGIDNGAGTVGTGGGGAGGPNGDGLPGVSTAATGATAGGKGDNGSGGAGAPGVTTSAGGNGAEFDASHGSGGGGGGWASVAASTSTAGDGGNYGAGGGGTGVSNSSGVAVSGDGKPGLIVITYSVVTAKWIFLTTTGAQTWTVPSDWNNGENQIFAIGGGGNGSNNGTGRGGGGGGGGAHATTTNLALTAGQTVYYQVGTANQDTWLNKSSNAAPASTVNGVLAKAGGNASASTGGTAGQAASCIGTANSGGAGGSPSGFGGGGGGGAGGPNGAGASGYGSAFDQGGGGGGADGGNAGQNAGLPVSGEGGMGGTNNAGSGGGAQGNGGSGGNGLYGGGGGGGDSSGVGLGGTGSTTPEWASTSGAIAGPGGGGGASGDNGSTTTGGSGGLYGGGGGGTGADNGDTGGPGAQGIIVIMYEP